MRRLAQTMAVTLLFAASPGRADETDGPIEDVHGLEGLTRLHVQFGELSVPEGVRLHGLRTRVERRVRAAGLRLSNDDGIPDLHLDVELLQLTNGMTLGPVTLRLTQPCTLERLPERTVNATTWSESLHVISSLDPELIRGGIDQATDELVASFLVEHGQVNGPQPPPPRRRWWQRLWPFGDDTDDSVEPFSLPESWP